MNIVVSKVYDKQRFKWFLYFKYRFPLAYATMYSKHICEYDKHMFANLTETEVRYLQATNSCRYGSEYICKLKIINPIKMPLKRKPNPNIPPYLDNERKSCIDISPQPSDEPKQESLDLFHVTFTKIILCDEMLNEKQIQILLKDKSIKSINIIKQ